MSSQNLLINNFGNDYVVAYPLKVFQKALEGSFFESDIAEERIGVKNHVHARSLTY